jgi:hypothetical protein
LLAVAGHIAWRWPECHYGAEPQRYEKASNHSNWNYELLHGPRGRSPFLAQHQNLAESRTLYIPAGLGADWPAMRDPAEIRRTIYEWCVPKSLGDALSIGGALATTAWFVFGTDFGPWRPVLPLVAVAFFCFLLGSITLVRYLLYPSAGEKAAPIVPTKKPVKPEPAVEFWLPSNWAPGFRIGKLEQSEGAPRLETEEVQLRVVAKRRLQNVRLEISVKHWGHQLDTLALITSDKFVGTVQKEVEQSFAIMRRTFRHAKVTFNDEGGGTAVTKRLRVEHGVTFFPENPAKFQGELGQEYIFQVTIFHDDGPDKASFNIRTEPHQIFPQSILSGRDNIQPIMGH